MDSLHQICKVGFSIFASVTRVNHSVGWVGIFILVNPKQAEGDPLGLVQTVWPEGVTFEDFLFRRNEKGLSQ